MLILQSRTETRGRFWLRRSAWLSLLIVIGLGYLAYEPALARYRYWKQQRALRQAKEFIDKHDAANAQLALEVAFSASPTIETWRLAADMMDQVGAPSVLRMREHIVQMQGATVQDKAQLVGAALRSRDFNAARDALASMTREEANQPVGLAAALSFAIETNNRAVADALYDRLKTIAPNNDDFKVGQAMLHLRNPNPEVAAAARKDLAQWGQNPKYSLRVYRELMSDATRRRDFVEAKRWAAELVADPHSTLADRLNQANLELLIDKKPFAEVFAEVAPKAAGDPNAAAGFARWVMVQGKVVEADRWLSSLAPAIRDSSVVMIARAEAVAQLKDWDRLTVLLVAGAWGPCQADTVHLAMAARVVGGHGGPAQQRQVWDEAIQSANGNLASLIVLQHLATFWGWSAESEAVLWTIARDFPDQTWVEQTLFDIYRSRRDAANMREVMNLLRNNDPGIPRYQHDWALLSLLTNPTKTWDAPKLVMERLHAQYPTDPFFATGYAFALAEAGKGKEALAAIAALSPVEKQYPPRLPYLAFIYGVGRDRTQVERIQSLANGGSYLPEEDDLFLRAREELERKIVPVKPLAKPPAS